MKVLEAIKAGRILRPGVNYTDDVIMGWISTLDQELVLQAGETELPVYTNKNDDLFLHEPFSDAYKWYIAAQICLYDRDMDSYNNLILLYNNAITAFWRYKVTTGGLSSEAVINIW